MVLTSPKDKVHGDAMALHCWALPHVNSCCVAQEMANLLWSYATLGVYPGEAMLGAMAIHMSERIQAYRPQAISNSLWAYAKVHPCPRCAPHWAQCGSCQSGRL